MLSLRLWPDLLQREVTAKNVLDYLKNAKTVTVPDDGFLKSILKQIK